MVAPCKNAPGTTGDRIVFLREEGKRIRSGEEGDELNSNLIGARGVLHKCAMLASSVSIPPFPKLRLLLNRDTSRRRLRPFDCNRQLGLQRLLKGTRIRKDAMGPLDISKNIESELSAFAVDFKSVFPSLSSVGEVN